MWARLVFACCFYECVALATGRVPTLSAWTGRGHHAHPWLTGIVVAVLIAVLIVHLWRATPE